VLDRNSAFGDLQRKSELQGNVGVWSSRSRVVALPRVSFLIPSSSLFAEHSVITIATSFVLADRVQITSTNLVDSFRLYRPTDFLHRVLFQRVSAARIPPTTIRRCAKQRDTGFLFFESPSEIKQWTTNQPLVRGVTLENADRPNRPLLRP
jgi:hypothetical protein